MVESAEEKEEKAKAKQRALDLLNRRPSHFRWTLEGIWSRDALINEVERESGVGSQVIKLVEGFEKPGEETTTNVLGKRSRCLVCGTEVLGMKEGNGKVNCCGQDMEVLNPRPLPSSD